MLESGHKFEILLYGVVVTMVFGTLGNALTLIAITYATIKQRSNFGGDNWIRTTIFIFNLSFVELVYCLLNLGYMLYGVLLWYNVIEVDTTILCQIFYLGIQELALIDGWSIALIAVTRALPHIK